MPDDAVKELDQVKRLLMLLLVRLGTSSEEIGLALGVSDRRVRQLVPISKIKKLSLATDK
jgi:hypothetical protein